MPPLTQHCWHLQGQVPHSWQGSWQRLLGQQRPSTSCGLLSLFPWHPLYNSGWGGWLSPVATATGTVTQQADQHQCFLCWKVGHSVRQRQTEAKQKVNNNQLIWDEKKSIRWSELKPTNTLGYWERVLFMLTSLSGNHLTSYLWFRRLKIHRLGLKLCFYPDHFPVHQCIK